MRSALVYCLIACGAANHSAGAQDTGEKIESIGSLIRVDVKPGPTQSSADVRAKVGDLLQFRITSPVMGRTVLSLQVSVDGDAKKVAVVNSAKMADTKPEPGSEGVSIFVVPLRRGRATVKITFIDNEGKPFRRLYNLDLVER
jgi:hypothetical protein